MFVCFCHVFSFVIRRLKWKSVLLLYISCTIKIFEREKPYSALVYHKNSQMLDAHTGEADDNDLIKHFVEGTASSERV